MNLKKFEIYLANLDPKYGTESGKIRPVVIVQSDLLNENHFSTIICPITTKVVKQSSILRVHLSKIETNLRYNSDIIIDQIRAIDNRRFIKKIGELSSKHKKQITNNLRILILE
ncbi:MAG: type II toxin-antitoxin system PemK/MazF family toxin [Candidatus Marinimicrobia bacterium]|nr:type II toxin-antitoxin system PemK/MazF family toxin [Candidatus Neomarinimicrobiota bacterium]